MACIDQAAADQGFLKFTKVTVGTDVTSVIEVIIVIGWNNVIYGAYGAVETELNCGNCSGCPTV